jgi:hypothetical protein
VIVCGINQLLLSKMISVVIIGRVAVFELLHHRAKSPIESPVAYAPGSPSHVAFAATLALALPQ